MNVFEAWRTVLVAVILISAVALGVRGFLRRRKEKASYSLAQAALAAGNAEEALKELLRAEVMWSVNPTGPMSSGLQRAGNAFLKDFERFRDIIQSIEAASKRCNRSVETQGLQSTLEQLTILYGDKKSFFFGSHKLKKEKQKEADMLFAKLELERGKLREACR